MISSETEMNGPPFGLPGAASKTVTIGKLPPRAPPPPPPPGENTHLASLMQKYQNESEILLKHKRESGAKKEEAAAINDTLKQLNNHMIEQKSKLKTVDKDIDTYSKIIVR
jgi:hypothetical protein